MGYVTTSLTLRNPKEVDRREMTVEALVDTGALHLCVPEHVALQLNLQELYKRSVTTADGKEHLCPYVGPVEVKFEDRGCFVGAIVIGDQVLLGAVPMEDMDLVVQPAIRRVTVNPSSPNIPHALVK